MFLISKSSFTYFSKCSFLKLINNILLSSFMDPYLLISLMILMIAFVFVYSLHNVCFFQVAFLGEGKEWFWLFWSLCLALEYFHRCLVNLGSLPMFKGNGLKNWWKLWVPGTSCHSWTSLQVELAACFLGSNLSMSLGLSSWAGWVFHRRLPVSCVKDKDWDARVRRQVQEDGRGLCTPHADVPLVLFCFCAFAPSCAWCPRAEALCFTSPQR